MSGPPADIDGLELLSNEEMAAADRAAVELGVPFLVLMENAGRAVADEAARMVPMGGRITVLCGPGNNGGDGFMAARLLRERGYAVSVLSLAPPEALKGAAGEMARRWGGEVLVAPPLRPTQAPPGSTAVEVPSAGADAPGQQDGAAAPPVLKDAHLIIDALYGAGLNRPLEGYARDLAKRMLLPHAASSSRNAARPAVLAVDVPSGLNGSTGDAPAGGYAVQADRTITFFRRKPGHLLQPGRSLCGDIVVADIGFPEGVLRAIKPQAAANAPRLWLADFPRLRSNSHKYTRGHALVVSGPPEQTGAARLGARGALRAGAGLVTVASPRAAFPVNAAHLTAIMLAPFEVPGGLARILEDKRRNAVLIGPGCGVGAPTREMVAIALKSGAAVVLDADALTSFAADTGAAAEPTESQPGNFGFLGGARPAAPPRPEDLFAAIRSLPMTKRPVVVTPHEGEFKRLFPDLTRSKLERARRAAARSGAVVILKGPDTVIADPHGMAAINENAPPWLATAGSGDVLAGFVTGLLAQGMSAFQAACAAVWLHGACAGKFGPGLIAEDIPELLPRVLARLLNPPESR